MPFALYSPDSLVMKKNSRNILSAEQITRKAIELSSVGKHEDARKAFSDVVRLHPKDSGAWLNLGICCIALGDIKTSEEAFNRAIELEPQNSAAYTNLASTWVSRGEPGIAITILEQGLRINEQNSTLLATKGALLAQIGEISQAIACLSQAYSQTPNDFSVTLVFAELLVQQHWFAEAFSILCAKPWPHTYYWERYNLACGRAAYGCRDHQTAHTAIAHAKQAGSNEANKLLALLMRGWGARIESKRIVMEPLRAIHAQQQGNRA
jgi:Flp pilus assembly protein TadD